MTATAGILPLFKNFKKLQRNISCLLSRVSHSRYWNHLIYTNKNLGWGVISNHVGSVAIRMEDSEIWRFILAAREQAEKKNDGVCIESCRQFASASQKIDCVKMKRQK